MTCVSRTAATFWPMEHTVHTQRADGVISIHIDRPPVNALGPPDWVALREAIDGVFIFAAICVGLAAGIGYLGIAAVMTVFFCFSCLFLWHVGFGENPLDTAQHEKKRAKLAQPHK